MATTVVAVVGGDGSTLTRLRGKANIAVYQPDRGGDGVERAVAAWDLARRTRTTYFVHDADPLVSIADAWGRYFAGRSPRGELELAVRDVLIRWKAGSLQLPDYYLVCWPEDWSPERRHWYLGLLADASATRVLTVDRAADPVVRLATLPAGRWWPDLGQLLDGIERMVPDQTGLPGAAGVAPRQSAPAETGLTTSR